MVSFLRIGMKLVFETWMRKTWWFLCSIMAVFTFCWIFEDCMMMGVIRMLCALFLLYMKLPHDLELLWQLLCNFFRLLIPNWVLQHFVSHLVFGLAVWHIAISYQFSVFLNKLFSLVAIISIGYFWSISLVIIPDVIFCLHIGVIRWF